MAQQEFGLGRRLAINTVLEILACSGFAACQALYVACHASYAGLAALRSTKNLYVSSDTCHLSAGRPRFLRASSTTRRRPRRARRSCRRLHHAAADLGLGDDHRRLAVVVGLGLLDGLVDGLEVVAVREGDDVPAVGLVAGRRRPRTA